MIWIREVNSSMLNYVKTLMTDVTDHKGNVIDVKTFISKPSGELQMESYPSVTITLDRVVEANNFNNHNSYTITHLNESMVSKKLEANKYAFDYTINFWAKNPIELDSMTKKFMMNTPKHGLIDVKDTDTDTIYECRMTLDGGLSVGGVASATTGTTIFRQIFLCHIIVGIDNNPSMNYTVVNSIHNTKEDM